MFAIESLNTIAYLKEQNAYVAMNEAIWVAIQQIKMIESECERVKLLLIGDDSKGNTIGHFALESNQCVQFASTLLLQLNADNMQKVLLRENDDSYSVFDAYLRADLALSKVFNKLSATQLYDLLASNHHFRKVIAIKGNNQLVICSFWHLLKQKLLAHGRGVLWMSTLLNLDCESVAPANNGWTMALVIMKLGKIELISDFLDFLKQFPKESLQKRFSQPNLEGETFISLLMQKITSAVDSDEERVKLIVDMYHLFDNFNSTQINVLKKIVRESLLALPPSASNLTLLKEAVDKNTLLGRLCWLSRKPWGLFSPKREIPFTIMQLRLWIEQLEGQIGKQTPTETLSILIDDAKFDG